MVGIEELDLPGWGTARRVARSKLVLILPCRDIVKLHASYLDDGMAQSRGQEEDLSAANRLVMGVA